MQALKKLTTSRWFPTLSKPILAGALGSGVVFGLHALGITSFTSNEVNAAAAPLVGFLITAITTRSQAPASEGQGVVTPEPQPVDERGRLIPAPSAPDVIHTIVPLLLPNLEQLVRDDPNILLKLLADAQKTVVSPASGPRKVAIVQPTSAAVIPVLPTPTITPDPPADAVDEHGNLTQAPVAGMPGPTLDSNGYPLPPQS